MDQGPAGVWRRSGRHGCHIARVDGQRPLCLLLSDREGGRRGIRQGWPRGVSNALIRTRFEATPSEERYDRRRWGDVLRAIYLAQRNPAAYEALAEQTGLEPRDCLALATIFVSRKPDLALTWVDRGIELDRRTPHGSAAGYDLARLQRELLTKLGREDEALDAAWAEYRKSPSKFSFDDLMKVVPKAERAAWREKALDAAKGADLHSVMELLVETKETERLAELVRVTNDVALENTQSLRHRASGHEAGKATSRTGRSLVARSSHAHRRCRKEQILRSRRREPRAGPQDATCAPDLSRNGRMPCARYGPITTVRPPSWRRLSPSQPGPGIRRRLHSWNVPKTAGV